MLDESLRLEIARLQNRSAKTESAGGNHSPEVESHVDRLLKLLKKLESINDRADSATSREPGSSQDFDLLVIAALREAECADLIEKTMDADLTALCDELKRKDEALQAHETALARLKDSSEAQLAALETRIQEQENRLINLQAEQRKLASERDQLANRLSTADAAAEHAEANAREFERRLQDEVSALRLQLESRGPADGGQADAAQAEGDQTKNAEIFQHRLQEAEAKLAMHEKDLAEKERIIHAAGIREKELGKLIERISAECEKLSAELCEKRLTAPRNDQTLPSFVNGKPWGKIIRLIRPGRPPSKK